MRVNKLLALFCIGAFVMVACSVTVDLGASPSSTPTQQDTDVNQVSTRVAQTLQASMQTALFASSANSATPAVTATASSTPMPPTLSVGVATNCYTGPNANYAFVITIRPGTTVTVVGRDTADNYWIIDAPGYPGTICWLSGQYASISGDTSNLSAPATPVPPYTLAEPANPDGWCSAHWGWWRHWSYDGTRWSHHWDGGGWYCP